MYQTTSGCDDISRALHGGRATVKPDTRGVQAGGEPAGTIQNAQIVVLARKRLAALLDCLETLLTQAAPTPVPVPGSAVVQLWTALGELPISSFTP